MAYTTTTKRIRDILKNLSEAEHKLTKQVMRASLAPRQDGAARPLQARNSLTDQAMLQLEQNRLQQHRLRKLLDYAAQGFDAECNAALDAWEHRSEPSMPGVEMTVPALGARLKRELTATTNPWSSEYKDDPEFRQSWRDFEKKVLDGMEQHDKASTDDQIAAARFAYDVADFGLDEDLDPYYSEESDPKRAERNADTFLGPQTWMGGGDKARAAVRRFAESGPSGPSTGDTALDAALREALGRSAATRN